MGEADRQALLPGFPQGRIGQPADAARLVAFLAGAEAQWITGQVIHADGGFFDAAAWLRPRSVAPPDN